MECIVISKKFFLSHCTEAMKRRLLLEVKKSGVVDSQIFHGNTLSKLSGSKHKNSLMCYGHAGNTETMEQMF